MRTVVLTGPSGAGKTTLGAQLAADLGVPFRDTDAAVERESGDTVASLFAREGEAAFRSRERRVMEAWLGERTPCVIATGGGTLVDTSLRHGVLRTCHVIGLAAPVETLAARVVHSGVARPLIDADPVGRAQALLAAREPVYAEVHATVPTGGEPAEALARLRAALTTLTTHRTLVVPLGTRTYPIVLAPRESLATALHDRGVRAVVGVTDRVVARALGGLDSLERVPWCAQVMLSGRGERDKTLRSVTRIWDAAVEAGLDRHGWVLGMGGGVVTDLAGFAAATLLRGVSYASVPTTLLAMVDASVGGKTGFDHPLGKNLLGAFHQPSLVVCDPSALKTLPMAHRRAGVAEIAKIALACDAELLDDVRARAGGLASGALEDFASVLPGAIQAKIDVVARDERETGERALLNFGHTLGHAVERASNYTLSHGDAVALGMRAAMTLGADLGITPADVARESLALLDALGLPDVVPAGIAERAVLDALSHDKKRRDHVMRFVLLTAPGRSVVTAVPTADVRRAVRGLLQIGLRKKRRVPSSQ